MNNLSLMQNLAVVAPADSAEVRGALDRANGSVKLAVLLLHGHSLDEATQALDRAEGRLRAGGADQIGV